MLSLFAQIGPAWYILFPLAAVGAIWLRGQHMARAARCGLVRAWAWRRLRAALALCGTFLLVTFLSVFYDTALWPPALATLCIVGMTLLVRSAAAGLHPGLHGFHWPMPVDGLDLLERERTIVERRAKQRTLLRKAPVGNRLRLPFLQHTQK